MARPPRGTQIWSINLDAAAPTLLALDRAHCLLPEIERDRLTAIHDPLGRTRRLAAAIGTRLILEQKLGRAFRGCTLERTPDGKPLLPPNCGDFSLTHSGALALVALCGAAVGIDAEALRSPLIDASRRKEIEAAAVACTALPLHDEAADARFLRAWTRLEALAKAEGTGIGRLLAGLGIFGPSRRIPEVTGIPSECRAGCVARYHVYDLDLGHAYLGAVAIDRSETWDGRIRELPSDQKTLASLLTE